jgi:hypothetical protein
VEQFAPLTMGWCLQCHRENAKLPVTEAGRAVASLQHRQKPAVGLDCGSCHY